MGFFGGGGSAASNMVGATSSVAGTAGLVPAPAAGDEHKILRGDATFAGTPYTQKQNTEITNRAIIRFDGVSQNYFGVNGQYSFSNNRMWFLPIYIPSTISSYNFRISAPALVATRNCKVGIYDLGTDTGLPKNRKVVSSEFDLTCAGDTEFSVAMTTTLTSGFYFLSCVLQTGRDLYGYNTTGFIATGIQQTGISNTLRQSVTYGSTDFPSTLTASGFTLENSQMPRMYITGL